MNGSSYTVSIRKRDQLPIWRTHHDDSHGCPEDFSDAAMQFYLMITALFKLPLRQTTGSVVSLLSMAKLDWAVPYYTNFCQLQKRLAIQSCGGAPKGPSTCWLTALAPSSSATANGWFASTVFRAVVNGARCIRRWTRPLKTTGRWTSPLSSNRESRLLPTLRDRIPEGTQFCTLHSDRERCL